MSEREKQILYFNAYLWNLENGTDEPVCRAEIETQGESGRGGGGGVMNWEIGIDMDTLMCIKWMTNMKI